MLRYQLNGYHKQALSLTIMTGLLFGQYIVPLSAQAESRLPSLEQLSAKSTPTGSAKNAATAPSLSSLPVRGQITLTRDVDIVPPTKKVSLSMRDANIRDILNLLAKQGGFNILMDESIAGTLTVDVNNISINKALEYIFTVSNFAYTRDGNTLIVASQEAADEKKLAARTFKAIPVQYKSAEDIATQINDTIFSMNRPNGQKTAVVAYDGASNSLLVMGSDTDLKLVGDFLREMDVPRNRRVYPIRHNTPEYVANVVMSNLFTPADYGTFSSGSGGSGGGNGGGNNNGGGGNGGGNNNGGGGNGGGNNNGGGGNGGGNNNGGGGNGGASTGGGGVGSALPLVFNNGGVTLIADAVSSTLTVMGTEEQMSLVESIIDQVDVRRPQVAIEVSLVEMSATDTKSLFFNNSNWRIGKFQMTLPTNVTGATTFSFNHTPVAGSTDPLHRISGSNTNTQRRVKVLANPTLIAMDGQQSTISVTDQIATISSVTSTATPPVIATTITTTPVGITLAVTPRVYNDGSVELNLAPNVSSPGEVVGDPTTALTTLVSTRSMQINAVRIPDGETLVIGGLLNTNQNKSKNRSPFLGDIPGVGALFNQNSSQQLKTELVIVVTPHILKDDGVTYFSNPPQAQSHFNNTNQGRIQPVNLPKFMGDEAAFPPGVPASQNPAPHGPQSRLPMPNEKLAVNTTASELIGPMVPNPSVSLGMMSSSGKKKRNLTHLNPIKRI